MEERRDYWDMVKGALAILVVLGHTLDGYLDSGNLVKSVHLFIYYFHMPLFIFISGLFTKNLTWERTVSKFLYFIKLTLLAQIIYALNSYISTGIFDFDFSYMGAWPWYAFACSAFIIFTYVLQKFNNISVLILSIFIGIIIGYESKIFMEYSLSRIFVFYPFFYLGYMTNLEKLEKLIQDKRRKYISLLMLLTIFIVTYFNMESIEGLIKVFKGVYPYSYLEGFYSDYKLYGPILRAVMYVVSTAISLMFLTSLSTCQCEFFKRLGKYSLEIYLLHFTVINIVSSFLNTETIAGLKQIYIVIICLLFSTFTAFILSNRYIKIIMDKLK